LVPGAEPATRLAGCIRLIAQTRAAQKPAGALF
jgi:hypothetical protein